MAANFPPDGWAGHVAQLATAVGAGGIALKVLEKMFARADKRDDLEVGLRSEMLRRLDSLEKGHAELEKRERAAYERSIALEAENRGLRRRYHQLINWLSAQPGLPDVPVWLREDVPGPTADEALRRPATGDTP